MYPDNHRPVLTVSLLNAQARHCLESQFSLIWVEGEISNLIQPSSGHLYFSLKDNRAQISCAMFRFRCSQLSFKPANGQQVLLKGKLSIYENRGNYQLLVESLEDSGDGALLRAFHELKNKLHRQGLFAKTLPLTPYPKTIAIISSATGAAVYDVLSVLKRRYPLARILIYPAIVQGEQAAKSIYEQLSLALKQGHCETIILARGGGSLEDLQAFNDVALAHLMFNSTIPIISGIGHEVDSTIADFVADYRAATPSAAAELAALEVNGLTQRLESIDNQLKGLIRLRINHQHQRLDRLQQKLLKCLQFSQSARKNKLTAVALHLKSQSPLAQWTQKKIKLNHLIEKTQSLMQQKLAKQQTKLANSAHALSVISPLATLVRGYAITTNVKNKIITSAHQVKKGQLINVRLAKGNLGCTIDKVKYDRS